MQPRLTDFVNDRLVAEAPADERAIAGNFRMEERLPKDVQDSYGSYFSDTPLSSLDDWCGFHKDFLDEQVNLTTDAEHPWTFRGGNARNLKPQDPITILQVESLDGTIGVSGATLSVTEIEQYVCKLHTGTKDQQRAAERVLDRFVDAWNRKRDRRPQFATNVAGVQDIRPADPWSGTDWSWVADLRDHLGLGTYLPKTSGEPLPMLILAVRPYPEPEYGARHQQLRRVHGHRVSASLFRLPAATLLGCRLYRAALDRRSVVAGTARLSPGMGPPVGGGAPDIRERDPTMSTTSITAPADAAGRWLTRFREKPLEALDGALTGWVHLGTFNTLPPAVALGQIVAHPEGTLDGVLLRWLEAHWGKVEIPGLRTRRYVEALAEALRAVDLLGLSACRHWLREHAPADYRWLAALQVGGPATLLDALFATLDTVQPDRALEPLWLRLSRLDGQTPLDHGRVALASLRLLPAAHPSRPALATSLFSSLIRFAEGLARRGAGPDALHDEIEYLCALQSLTPAAIGRHLRKALNQRLSDRSRSLNKDAHAWPESAVPMAFKAPRQGSGQVVEHSPLPVELSEVVNWIRRDGLAKACGSLDRLTRDQRQYYERTGDSYYLVRCFERLSRTVRDIDPGLARDLPHEALRLEPSNHNNWVALGQALLRHGEDDAAFIAYAEAVRRFPHDPVATLGYGHALYELEGPDAALPVLRTGVQAHPDNLPLRSDYTDALIQAGEIAEAEQQPETARRINARSGGHDPKLDQLAERLDLAKAGRLQQLSLYRRDPVVGLAGNPDALSDIAGSGLAYAAALGESTLFRHAGELERANQAIRRLPAGPERDAEQGLWIAIHDSWGAAADWWRDRNAYETVTRIHALRSQKRSGEAVDWTPLTRDLPQYSPIIRSLARQDLPELSIVEDDLEDLKRDAWLYGEAASDPVRRDEAQEDWLAAAQII